MSSSRSRTEMRAAVRDVKNAFVRLESVHNGAMMELLNTINRLLVETFSPESAAGLTPGGDLVPDDDEPISSYSAGAGANSRASAAPGGPSHGSSNTSGSGSASSTGSRDKLAAAVGSNRPGNPSSSPTGQYSKIIKPGAAAASVDMDDIDGSSPREETVDRYRNGYGVAKPSVRSPTPDRGPSLSLIHI